MNLGTAWEQSFQEYQATLRQRATSEHLLKVEPSPPPPSPEIDIDALKDLLELSDAGMAVAWPSGFDQLTARAYFDEHEDL